MSATTGTTASTPSIGAIPATGVTQPRVNKNTLFSYTHTLKPNLFNDFRIGYHRLDFDTLNQFSVNGQPGAGTALGIPGFNGDTQIQQSRHPERQHQQLQRARRRRHELVPVRHDVPDVERAGLQPRLAQRADRASTCGGWRPAGARPTIRAGCFDFTGDITGYSVADFMLGLPRTVIPPTDQIQGHVGGWRNGFFVNDDWQATRNLTLSLGLRYELNTPVQTYAGFASMLAEDFQTIIPAPSAYPVKGFKFTEPNYKDIAPRLGATYRLEREDRAARRLRDLLQPEPDELVHVPDQQPADGGRVDVHARIRRTRRCRSTSPTGVAGPVGRARHDLADAASARTRARISGASTSSGSCGRAPRSTSSTSAPTPATSIAASSTTRRSRVRARSIRGGRARSSAAAASSRTI